MSLYSWGLCRWQGIGVQYGEDQPSTGEKQTNNQRGRRGTEKEHAITWLSSFEYDTTSTPVVDGSDGIWSSIPPTTCVKRKADKELSWKPYISTKANVSLSRHSIKKDQI